ncbi:prepilin peptidase [Lachnospiraceae bacterium ASD3451]|uniref:prepilin peptidase n=1 Tax=Diplocloster agilis TaxID=2850323 RepID=UPI001E0A2030|nr:A24 family peptidase [Diplocloster agilis]MBU9745965.1 prepilin peptidase [Diplocloster agilis]
MIQLLQTIIAILIFLFGASLFSFLNVVIYRVPRKISFVGGRSFCPDCRHTLGAPDMFPVLSYLFLRGKCRYCKAHISLRYPLVEILGGLSSLLCMAVYIDWEGDLWKGFLRFLTAFALLAVLTVVAFVDWDTMEIPNGFVLAAAVCGLVSFFAFPETGLLERLIGVFAVSVPLLLITLLVPGAFGGGDIKLMAACGLYLGWKLCLTAFVAAVLTGGIYGAYLLLSRKKGRKDHFAFGPFLCAGVVFAMFCGQMLIDWYLQFL